MVDAFDEMQWYKATTRPQDTPRFSCDRVHGPPDRGCEHPASCEFDEGVLIRAR